MVVLHGAAICQRFDQLGGVGALLLILAVFCNIKRKEIYSVGGQQGTMSSATFFELRDWNSEDSEPKPKPSVDAATDKHKLTRIKILAIFSPTVD
jgi:hypothetical protein